MFAFHLRKTTDGDFTFLAELVRLELSNRGAKHGMRRENHGPFHEILKLTNVSGPAIPHQRIHRLIRNLIDALLHSLSMDADEMPHELWNVLGALPQGRNVDGEHS